MEKCIEVDVYIYSESELILKELDIEVSDTEELLERRTFWRVDYAMPNKDNGQETVFFVGDGSFITPMEYDDFVELVNNNLCQ